MVNTFINPVVNPEAKLGVSLFDETDPVRLWPHPSEEDMEIVIRAVYRQVLGNAHVMESERLVIPESQLKQGEIMVREFVRQVAKSELYRSRFFDNCYRYRAIELNFKHLLGRAPESYEEMTSHSQLLDRAGYDVEIDSYLDSDEYLSAFGEDIVPYYRGYKTQTGKKMVGFTHLFQLLRGAASSDKDLVSGNRSRLNRTLAVNTPSKIVPLASASVRFPGQPSQQTDVGELVARVLGLHKQPPLSPASEGTTTPMLSGADSTWQRRYQGYQAFKDSNPVELWSDRSTAEVEIVIRAVYRQVLGNAHVMESERHIVPESQLKQGEITVREFVRQIAKSELYRSRFFDNCYRYRAIELNFKHLLGRAPESFEEMKAHSAVLDLGGFEAEIDSYLDSDEYQDAFGENIVPYYRGYNTQTGKKILAFTNMLQLLRSASSSDKDLVSGNRPQLTRSLIENSPFGKRQVTDVEKLLAEVFKPRVKPSEPTPPTSTISEADLALRRQCEEQERLVETLQQELIELRPFANIGSALVRQGQSASAAPVESGFLAATGAGIAAPIPQPGSYAAWQQKAEEQAALIAKLRQQIAEARSLATIGEFRLNKWRQRSF